MATMSAGEHLELYHRTTRDRAEQITRTGTWPAGENGVEVIASTHRDGEQDYHLPAGTLRPEHVTLAWDTDYVTSTDTRDEQVTRTSDTEDLDPARLAAPDRPQVDRGDAADDPIAVDDSTGITPTNLPVAGEPAPLQVDLHLGEAVYRQAAARGGFTPESTAAAEVTIEQAVTRQTVSDAARLHALADQVETARDNRATQPTAAPPVRPAPPAPPPRVELARARAASAQIWDDTREEYDPPAQTQRR